MDMVIEGFNRPAMLMRLIKHACKRGILESESHTRGICMWSNADNCMHQLIQQTSMRNNEIATSRSAQKTMQGLARAQE